ncbi:MAG: hypothetical protein ACJ75B_13015 [Flavisolibacter sp.]
MYQPSVLNLSHPALAAKWMGSASLIIIIAIFSIVFFNEVMIFSKVDPQHNFILAHDVKDSNVRTSLKILRKKIDNAIKSKADTAIISNFEKDYTATVNSTRTPIIRRVRLCHQNFHQKGLGKSTQLPI